MADLISMLAAAGGAGGEVDPNFNQTVLLLHGDGSDGTQNNTFQDSSSNNFTITRNPATGPNAPTQGTFSPFSAPDGRWGVYPGAQTTYAVTATSSALGFGTGVFTIEFWIYNQGSAGNQWLIDFRTSVSSTNPWLILNSSNQLSYGVGSSFLKTTVGTVPTHAWTHVALVKDSGGTVKFYVNGTADANTYADSNNFGASQRAAICTFGDAIGGANGVVFSYLSNLRIATSAVYTANFTPSTSPLSATGAAFLTFTSNRIYDQSSNGIAITSYGGIKVTPFSPFAPTAAYDASVNGGSGYFDGTGDYLSGIGSASDFNFIHNQTALATIQGWVYRTSSAAEQMIFDNCGGTGANIGFYLSITTAGNLDFNVAKGGGSGVWVVDATSSGVTIPVNAWTYIAVTYDYSLASANVAFYINGTAAGTVNKTANAAVNTNATYALNALGLHGGSFLFVGYAASLQISNNIRTGLTSIPTAPYTSDANTSLLLNFTNAGIFDQTGKNNLETVADAQIDTTTKKYGTGSLEFDGTGDWLKVPNSPDLQLGTGDFTIEFWVYLASGDTGSARGLVAKGGASTGWLVSLDSSEKVVFTYTTSTITSSGAITTNAWNHIAVVREGTGSNETKIYIGGTNDGTGTVSTDFNQTEVMYIGANRAAGDPMKGFIDDLRITKGVARYTTTFTPPTKAFPDL